MKKVCSLLLVLAVILSMGVTASAASTDIAYNGHKKITVYPKTTVYTDSDLFGSFKGVMPGDQLAEEIKITNWALDSDYVMVYMQAVAHDEVENPIESEIIDREESVATMKEFLGQLHMTVHEKNQEVFNDSPEQGSERIYLGSLRRGKSMTLDVKLSVPAELGNEFANRKGEVDWVFTFEGYKDSTPKTGDTIMRSVIVMAVAGAGLALLVILRRKKRKD